MPLSTQQEARLDHLRGLDGGWAGHGLGDAPTVPALTTAADVLAALPEHEQDAWQVDPEHDGGVRFERIDEPGAPETLIFVDVDRHGGSTVVWFDQRYREHQRRYPTAVQCAAGLLGLLDVAPALAA